MQTEIEKLEEKLNKKYSAYKIALYLAIALIFGFWIGFLYFKMLNTGNEDFRVLKIEIVQDNVIKSATVKAKLDSIVGLKLENDIKLVEEKNDGRFEVLTWSATLLITLLALFITVNFIVSISKVREIVDIELDKRTQEIKQISEKLKENYEAKTKEMDGITDETQKAFLKLTDYIEEYTQFKPKE